MTDRPDLPKDPAEYRPRPLLGIGFWALMAFAVLCVAAGAGVALLGPKLFAKPTPPAAAAPPPAPAPMPRPAAMVVTPAPAASPDEIARLNARIATLENQGARSSEAAAAALAAAELVDASQGSRSFAGQLVALRRAAPDMPELAALGRLAEVGAPSRAALAASFPPYAALASSRARKPTSGAPFTDRIAYVAAKVVTIRRVEDVSGNGPDALIARAEQALTEGEIVPALRLLDGLPKRSREVLAPWRAGADRRAEIDREVAALRERAIRDLAPPDPPRPTCPTSGGGDMIRAGVVLILIAAVAVGALALIDDPGHATVLWLGWRADSTAAAAVLMALTFGLLAAVIWRTILWILAAPRRAERARIDSRRRQSNDVLARGFLAVAAGDGSEALRLSKKAAEMAADAPGLVRVLAAQAAEAAGDVAQAQAAYSAMLGFPEMRLAGHKGLMQLALSQGARETALRHAQEAYGEARTARWAWRAVLEARLEAADWDGALALVKGAQDRKIVPPVVAERARAALLAASAAQLEHAPEPRARSQAQDQAVEAAKLQPGFAPGVVMAARLLAGDNKLGRASATLETAWRASPHPALWLAYRDLKTDETPRERAQRLGQLAAVNPTHRESLFLYVEQALVVGDAPAARAAAKALEGEPVTARIAGLMARAAYAAGAIDEARMWLAQGMNAPPEPDWSDLDPEGRAFAYHARDWARLVITFAEAGELIHPRHERRERTLRELPDLPLAYADAGPMLTEPVLYPVDEGYAEPETPPEPAPARRTGDLRRRTPRSGK